MQIGNLCEVKSSKRIYASEYRKKGIPFYRGKEIIELSNGQPASTEIFIDNAKYEQLVHKFGVPKHDDVLMTAVGTLGVPYYVADDNPFYFKDGNLIWFSSFKDDMNPKWFYYWLLSKQNSDFFNLYRIGSTQSALTIDQMKKIQILLPAIKKQQHIVDTIGSVDDLIEKYNQYSNLLTKIGTLLLSKIKDCEYKPILSICSFVKGKEIGSSNYSPKGKTPFIRVSNLDNHEYDNYTDLSDNLEYCQEDDLLIALDGAPGRVAYGLNGCYSSGIYRIECNKSYKGLIYFYLISDDCQQIIKSNSSGTTILHASKSIKEMNAPICSEQASDELNTIFESLISISKQIDKLKRIKETLLHKYFD